MTQLTWLITGCSSGFGREFVHQILASGDHVIATARPVEKIMSLQEAGAAILQLDVVSPQYAVDDIMAEAVKIYGHVDVLVNNASFVTSGS
jgi:NADP-dependent 3-hydroxy acid dehydrogenase YdfG